MEEKRDSLGRRIPQYDRSAAGKQAAKTNREKHGKDFYERIGSVGGSREHERHFAKLKTEDPERLREISKSAAEKSKVTRTAKVQDKKAKTAAKKRHSTLS